MKLAFLRTRYPKVSHSFIRREILELQRRGHEKLRLAIRDRPRSSSSRADIAEGERTFVGLGQSKSRRIFCESSPAD